MAFTLSFTARSQSYEQVALDCFAAEILPELTNVRVLFNGEVSSFDTVYLNLAWKISFDFCGCNLYEARRDTTTNEREKSRWLDKLNLFVDSTLLFKSPYPTITELEIPHQLGKRKKLRFWKRKRTLFGRYFSRVWHQNFTQGYNLFIRPVVEFEGSYIVLVEIIKRDVQYCDQYYIQMSEDRRVISYCKSGWVS